ncbi:hypothetical protein [Metapseudomonas sp. CR1201]
MRVSLNDQAKQELIALMEARGMNSPSCVINVVITEAFNAYFNIPIGEDQHGSTEQRRTA